MLPFDAAKYVVDSEIFNINQSVDNNVSLKIMAIKN